MTSVEIPTFLSRQIISTGECLQVLKVNIGTKKIRSDNHNVGVLDLANRDLVDLRSGMNDNHFEVSRSELLALGMPLPSKMRRDNDEGSFDRNISDTLLLSNLQLALCLLLLRVDETK
jgi:hypothetical protein